MWTRGVQDTANRSERALVLLSGGIDSAVCLYWAISQGWDVGTVEFEYFLRPEQERRACLELRDRAGIKNALVVPLDFIREVEDIPREMLANGVLRDAPEGYIPSRNLIFYAFCSYYAEVFGARHIVGGHNRTDAESFPDAGREFFECLNRLLSLGMWSHGSTGTRISLPLSKLGKLEVLHLGARLQVPFDLTWSCYYDAGRPCGSCVSCVERREAFLAAGISDTNDLQYGGRR